MSWRPRFVVVPVVALVALAALALSAAIVLPAFAGNAVRTLVVRGLVAKADGKPAVGARVSAKGPKGGVNVSATTDERGRFSLQMPMGSPTAIRAAAFSVEVRAEGGGKRLPLATGAPALGLVVDFAPGTSRLRVRSNSPAATAAVITAFIQDGAPTAWVDADFGGAVRASGDMALSAEDEIGMAGIAPAPGSGEREPERAKPVPARTPAPIKIKPEPAAPPVATPVAEPTTAAPKPATKIVKAPAPAPRVAKPAPDSAAIARAAAQAAARAEAREREIAARHTRDSLAALRRQDARDAKRAAAAKRKPATPTTPAGTTIAVTTAPADSARPQATPSPALAPVAPPRAAGTPRVVAIEPFAPPQAAPGADTCACRLRGTVEVDWERPLEKNIPVELTLEGPARQSTSVDLYMGPPREFRLGPLPCGDYKLTVRPRGRYRYALVRGDSVLTVHCDGHTQQRIVLEPVKR